MNVHVTVIGPKRRGAGDDLFCSKGLGAASVSSRLGDAFEELGFAACEVLSWESINPYNQTGTLALLLEGNWGSSVSWLSDLASCCEELWSSSGRVVSCWEQLVLQYSAGTASLGLELVLLAGWPNMLLLLPTYHPKRKERKILIHDFINDTRGCESLSIWCK